MQEATIQNAVVQSLIGIAGDTIGGQIEQVRSILYAICRFSNSGDAATLTEISTLAELAYSIITNVGDSVTDLMEEAGA